MTRTILALLVTGTVIALSVGGCGGNDTSGEWGPVEVGDSCDDTGTFACGRDENGETTGELLVCEDGAHVLALQCGDARGCFIEDSAAQGRCFHGDGTGQVCRYVGGAPSCCGFVEPDLAC